MPSELTVERKLMSPVVASAMASVVRTSASLMVCVPVVRMLPARRVDPSALVVRLARRCVIVEPPTPALKRVMPEFSVFTTRARLVVESETTSSAKVTLVPTSVGLVVSVTASLKVRSPVAATVVAPRRTVPSALVVRLASRWPAWPTVPSPPTTPPKVVTPEPEVLTLRARAVPLESIVEPKVTS